MYHADPTQFLQFEVYFTLPGVLTAGLAVSVVAQLGASATAGHWKVDLYEFAGKEDWTNIGDLTGGELYSTGFCYAFSYDTEHNKFFYHSTCTQQAPCFLRCFRF